LTPKQLSEVTALCHLIDSKLYPAILYIFWIDPKNHVELIRPWFAKVKCFFNYFFFYFFLSITKTLEEDPDQG
jgi:metaxin